MGKFVPDVDIDLADSKGALSGLQHIPASRINNGNLLGHGPGVYFQAMPVDPMTGLASIPYKEAEKRGYYKVDFLNLNIYKEVRDMNHMRELLVREPMWEMLADKEICDSMFQLGGKIDGIPTFELIDAYKPSSIMDIAIFLALIRPKKKHMLGWEWEDIKKDIWTPGDPDLYGYKKAHAISYAHVIVIQMNLLLEQLENDQ